MLTKEPLVSWWDLCIPVGYGRSQSSLQASPLTPARAEGTVLKSGQQEMPRGDQTQVPSSVAEGDLFREVILRQSRVS